MVHKKLVKARGVKAGRIMNFVRKIKKYKLKCVSFQGVKWQTNKASQTRVLFSL